MKILPIILAALLLHAIPAFADYKKAMQALQNKDYQSAIKQLTVEARDQQAK
ncbi:MAG: hypothetical protein ACREUY_05115 [Burkholderiales bacterium]